MFPNGTNFNGIWGSDNFLFGSALFDSRRRNYSELPEEVQTYLAEHEAELRTEEDAERLVHEYSLKK